MSKRKLSSAELADRKKKRNSIIIGIILVGLMIFSMAGYALSNNNAPVNADFSGFDYEDYSFETRQNNGNYFYVTKINGFEVAFYSTPYQVNKLSLDEDFLESFLFGDNIYFSSEPLPVNGQVPLYQQYLDLIVPDIMSSTNRPIMRGYLKTDMFNEGTVITCDDASNSTSVVVYAGEPNNVTSAGIYSSNISGCFDMYVSAADLILLRDYLVYVHWGILNE
ncbi:hypothetical protein K9L97_00745 [Candidatus Woesearchaeota archaeon]|nr:hypothetical protein [Candidatus Woesearchaeota archaeon]